MYTYCAIENIVYLCKVNDKQTFTKPPGLAKARQTFFPGIKKRVLQEYPPGKKKDKTLLVCRKTKIRFSFRSYKNIQKEKRSLKKYRINVIRVPVSDPVHYHSLILSRLA